MTSSKDIATKLKPLFMIDIFHSCFDDRPYRTFLKGRVVLRVRLVPTGEVVDVGVEQSSGNEAFDRSALLAVERSARFQVPSDPKLFENNFRSFTVLFRPEDLLL